MPSVHFVLSRLPDNLPIEHLCTYAGDLFVQYSPDQLEQEALLQYELCVFFPSCILVNLHLIQHDLFIFISHRAKLNQEKMQQSVAAQRNGPSHRRIAKRRGKQGPSLLVRLTVWSLVGAVAAAAVAVYSSAWDWGWLQT